MLQEVMILRASGVCVFLCDSRCIYFSPGEVCRLSVADFERVPPAPGALCPYMSLEVK